MPHTTRTTRAACQQLLSKRNVIMLGPCTAVACKSKLLSEMFERSCKLCPSPTPLSCAPASPVSNHPIPHTGLAFPHPSLPLYIPRPAPERFFLLPSWQTLRYPPPALSFKKFFKNYYSHTIFFYPLKVYNLLIFRIFTKLYNQHHYLIPEPFIFIYLFIYLGCAGS